MCQRLLKKNNSRTWVEIMGLSYCGVCNALIFRCGVVDTYVMVFRHRKGPCTLLLHMTV